MTAYAIGAFFYNPLMRATSCLIKRVPGPTIEKVTQIASSVLSKVITNAIVETGGVMAGSLACEAAFAFVCVNVSPPILACLSVLGLTYSVVKKNRPLLIPALVATTILSPIIPAEQRVSTLLSVGSCAANVVGTILGGYAGLKLIGNKISLVDRVSPTDSYSVNMFKFLLVGGIYENVIVKSSIPYISPFFNFPRGLVKVVFQAMAYNSQDLIPIFQKCVREKTLAPTLPSALQMISNRYCIKHSPKIARSLTKLVSETIFPSFVNKKGDVILVPFTSSIQSAIEKLGKNSGTIATVAMRGFVQYMDLLKKLDPIKLEEDLQKRMHWYAQLSPIITNVIGGNIKNWSSSILQVLQESEIELFGLRISGDEQSKKIEEMLSIHLKYYLFYILSNFDKLSSDLSPMEERDFLSYVGGTFFSVYTNPSSPNVVARFLQKATHVLCKMVYLVRKFVERAEQNTMIEPSIKIVDDYYPEGERTENKSSENDFEVVEIEDQF